MHRAAAAPKNRLSSATLEQTETTFARIEPPLTRDLRLGVSRTRPANRSPGNRFRHTRGPMPSLDRPPGVRCSFDVRRKCELGKPAEAAAVQPAGKLRDRPGCAGGTRGFIGTSETPKNLPPAYRSRLRRTPPGYRA